MVGTVIGTIVLMRKNHQSLVCNECRDIWDSQVPTYHLGTIGSCFVLNPYRYSFLKLKLKLNRCQSQYEWTTIKDHVK